MRPSTARRVPTPYDTIAPEYARHRAGQPFVIEMLRGLHARAREGAVLEVGCGTGDYAGAFAERSTSAVYGLDPSREMLRHGARADRLFRVQGHAGSLPFADGAFHMIFSVNVIHHLKSVAPYFEESFRALAPGGILCTATDSEAIIRRRDPLSRYWPATVPVELERYHRIDDLRAAMAAVGFRDPTACEGRSTFPINDAGPYRDKAFSCLRLIPEEAFARGLDAMETDLRAGPLEGASELVFLWAKRP